MNRPFLSDRRNSRLPLNPRNVFVAALLAILFGFALAWLSIPARAGAGDIASGPSTAFTAPQSIIVERSAVVDPMKLAPPSIAMRPRSRPRRRRDPVAYRNMKAAMAAGAILPEAPSILSLPLATTPTVLTDFIGLAADESCGGCEPPDTQVAAGPNHVFEVDNVAGKIFSKTGTTVMATFGLNGLFNLNSTLFTSDPRIRYDTISGRWFISMLSLDTSDITTASTGQYNLAVSTSSDPTQLFNVYSFPTPGNFPDQPSLGFNDDKVVSSGASFSCNPNCGARTAPLLGSEFVVWNKSEVIAGTMNAHTDYFAPPEDFTGFPIMPAKSRSSTSTLFMASAPDNSNPTSLTLWKLTGVPDGMSGTSVATAQLTINNLPDPPDAKQKGSQHRDRYR